MILSGKIFFNSPVIKSLLDLGQRKTWSIEASGFWLLFIMSSMEPDNRNHPLRKNEKFSGRRI